MKLKVKLDPGAIMPTRAHETDAGLDLYAMEKHLIPCGESVCFDTGVHVQIPAGYVGMIKSKSGLNVNHNITSEGTRFGSGEIFSNPPQLCKLMRLFMNRRCHRYRIVLE
mgnify:CR=1 FL=1